MENAEFKAKLELNKNNLRLKATTKIVNLKLYTVQIVNTVVKKYPTQIALKTFFVSLPKRRRVIKRGLDATTKLNAFTTDLCLFSSTYF